MKYDNYYLSQNPFTLIPDKEQKNLPWAGFKKIREKLDKVFESILKNDETKLILNLSRWGGGKTHTSYYYSDEKHLKGLVKSKFPLPLNILITTPREGNNATDVFYKKILDDIGISYLCDCVIVMSKELGETKSLELLNDWTKNEDLGRILWLMGDEKKSFEASELLFNKPTATQRRNLKVRRGVGDDTDKFNTLSAVIRLISEFSNQKQLEKPRRVIIWLDEFESLVYYSTKQYRPFTQGLRELIDKTPKNLALLINFSFAEPDDVQTLEFIIGSALLDRANEQIIFEEADIDHALEYVKELLKFYRTEDFKNENEFYPFTKDSLTVLLELAEKQTGYPLMPRTINKWCLKAIEKAENEKVIKSNKDIINSTIVSDISFTEDVFN